MLWFHTDAHSEPFIATRFLIMIIMMMMDTHFINNHYQKHRRRSVARVPIVRGDLEGSSELNLEKNKICMHMHMHIHFLYMENMYRQ